MVKADIIAFSEASHLGLVTGATCAFGVFDGVHLGHRFVIDQAIAEARELGGRSFVLTFDRDPDELFCADRLVKLTGNETRLAMLAETGVDFVAVLAFNEQFASQEPLAFLESTFGNALPAAIHIGHDFRFGARAAGTLETLEHWGSARGVHVVGHELLEVDGAPVTSTRIRGLLATGDEKQAEKLLGHTLSFE